MSFRRIRRAEMLSRAHSNADLMSSGTSVVGGAPSMRKCASCPSIVRMRFAKGTLSPSSLALHGNGWELRARKPASQKQTFFKNEDSILAKMPVEIILEIAGHLNHADLLKLRGTSKACKRIADCKLIHTTAAMLAIYRENLDVTVTALQAIEKQSCPAWCSTTAT